MALLAGYDTRLASLRLEVRIGSVLLGLNTTLLVGVFWMLLKLTETVARLSH